MRKRLRDEESNKRRNHHRSSSERNSPEMEDVKIQLFNDNNEAEKLIPT
jgi:hypothetical protein